MEGLRQYAVSVIAAALICGILTSFPAGTTAKTFLRMLCGVFMTITVLTPLVRIDLSKLNEITKAYYTDAAATVSLGENMAMDALQEVIKQKAETYIMDKAGRLNASLSVEVVVGEDHIPKEVYLEGKISPYVKSQLERILESDLGITKERQIWTG